MARASHRGSALEGFGIIPGQQWAIYAPADGERRKLRFTLHPDLVAEVTRRPELLDALYAREVLTWIERMEARGWYLASRPSPPKLRRSLDPKDPPGSRWVVVEARWRHWGPVAVLRDQDYVAKREEEERIGAGQLKGDGGVRKFIEEAGDDGLGDVELFGGDVGCIAGDE